MTTRPCTLIDVGAIDPDGPPMFFPFHVIEGSMDHQHSLFRGPIVNRRCLIECRSPDGNLRGNALIDTGAERSMVSARFAAALGVVPAASDKLTVHALGAIARKIAFARFEIDLVPESGNPVRIRGQLPIDDMAPGVDVLLGMSELANGTLSVNGPAGTWEWLLGRRPA